MLDRLIKIKAALVKVLEAVVMILMAVLVLDVVWQVITRLASNIPKEIVVINPSRWTDELAVMLMIWVALLGASVAYARKGHLGVDYFVGKLPGRVKIATEMGVYTLVTIFAIICMVYGGVIFVMENTRQMSPALNIPMGAVYIAIPISGFFFLMISIESFIECVAAFRAAEGNRT